MARISGITVRVVLLRILNDTMKENDDVELDR